MVRSGLSPITGLANLAMLQSWVWQLGGEFYNTETGKWNFSTAEGKAAAQALYDLYWTDKVASFDLANINNETTQFQRGLVSSNLNGMWQISSIEETVPGFSADRDRDAPSDGAHRFGLGPRRDLGYHVCQRRLSRTNPNCSTVWASWRS